MAIESGKSQAEAQSATKVDLPTSLRDGTARRPTTIPLQEQVRPEDLACFEAMTPANILY
jgi:hypothetical protein